MMLPPLSDLLDRLHVVALPMRVRFRGITAREVALIDGPAGWGSSELSSSMRAPEAARWLAAGIESAYAARPPALRDRVPINATVPAVGPDQVAGVLARFPGATTAKVKVAEPGQSLADDVARVNAVRQLIATVRVDANGGWTVDQAVAAARVERRRPGRVPRAAVPHGGRTGRSPGTGDGAGRCRRHPQGRGPVAVARAGPPTSPSSKVAPSAGRRHARHRRRIDIGGGLQRWTPRSGSPRADRRGGAAEPGACLWAGHRGLFVEDVADLTRRRVPSGDHRCPRPRQAERPGRAGRPPGLVDRAGDRLLGMAEITLRGKPVHRRRSAGRREPRLPRSPLTGADLAAVSSEQFYGKPLLLNIFPRSTPRCARPASARSTNGPPTAG